MRDLNSFFLSWTAVMCLFIFERPVKLPWMKFQGHCSKLLFYTWLLLFSFQELIKDTFLPIMKIGCMYVMSLQTFFFCKFTHQSHKYCNWLVLTLQELIWYALQMLAICFGLKLKQTLHQFHFTVVAFIHELRQCVFFE